MTKFHPRRLLVEGDEDKRVIPEFVDKFVVWGEKKAEAAVLIKPFDGIDPLLKAGAIEVELNVADQEALGIIIDADDQRDSRWAAVRRECRKVIPGFPEVLPSEGLIHVAPTGLRVGVWIMPDNEAGGMLETFLGQLIPTGQDSLWAFAQQCRVEAKGHGAAYSDFHLDKADIHTYLAWLDPPGQQLHIAVLRKALDARTPLGLRFARWFVDLFQLTPRDPTGLAS